MAAEIISGTAVAEQIRGELKQRVTELKAKGIQPGVVFVRVGEDPASVSYVAGKGKAADELGILSETIVLPENTPEQKLLEMHVEGEDFVLDAGPAQPPKLAFLGIRPCELAAGSALEHNLLLIWGAEITRGIANGGINLRGVSAAAIGRKVVFYVAVESEQARKDAMRITRKLLAGKVR